MAAALSLKCGQCGTQLKSVAEAQLHGETTGHSQFEESTEAMLNLTCTECGKPCRSQTEVDLHRKRTGHDNYVDKTNEASAMDTASEMKAVAAEQREEAGLPPATDSAAAHKEGEQVSAEVEMVAPEVDASAQQQLQDMGFSANKAIRALHSTGTSNIEQAINWLDQHSEDADLDQPLLIPKEEPKVKLSPEQARAAAEDAIRKTKAKREKEERELERLREQERVRSGKELLAAKKLEQEGALRRNVEDRAREKREEQKARERIRAKLAEDKRERRRKLGLPEEQTEEELAKEAAEAAQKQKAAEAGKLRLPVKPVSATEKLRSSLVEMKKSAGDDDERPKTAWATLLKMLGNVVNSPTEQKFRRIRLTNPAIQKKVTSLPGALQFLELVGFEKDAGGEVLEMADSKVDIELLNVAGNELQNAMTNPFFGKL